MNQNGRGGIAASCRGFSLVELLVVVAIFGVVSTVILDLYVNVIRSTTTSEEVVEVQQGMRIALEQMARDIQMSGFLVPTGIPITVAQNDQLTLVTASAYRTFARIGATTSFTVANGTDAVNVTVGSAAMARLFTSGDFVRIVRPATGAQLGIFLVTGVHPAPTSPTLPYLELTPLAAPAADIIVANADMIVRVPNPGVDATFPNSVTYLLEPDPISTTANMRVLSRIWYAGMPALTATNRDTGNRVLATKITALRFEYLLNDGTVAPPPAAAAGTALTAIDRGKIVGVRIFLTGLGEAGKTRGVVKTRELQTTVKIRNI